MREAPYPPRAQRIAFTLGSRNIFMRSPARCRSVPARKPRRWRRLGLNLALKPKASRAATVQSRCFGLAGALAGVMIPMVSPKFRRGGLMSPEAGVADFDTHLFCGWGAAHTSKNRARGRRKGLFCREWPSNNQYCNNKRPGIYPRAAIYS